MAEELKAKGNQALQAGNPKEAVGFYTQAIEIDGKNKVYFSNRSAAFMKQEDFRSALAWVTLFPLMSLIMAKDTLEYSGLNWRFKYLKNSNNNILLSTQIYGK